MRADEYGYWDKLLYQRWYKYNNNNNSNQRVFNNGHDDLLGPQPQESDPNVIINY